MALYNEILVGRFNRLLQKLFGLKGKTGAPQLAGEVLPVLPFFNGVELRYLEAWDLFMQQNFLAGAAGNKTAVQYRNPLGSNVIAVVESIYVMGALTDLPTLTGGSTNTDLATPLTAVRPIDSRSKRLSSTLVGSISNNLVNPALAMAMKQVAFPANQGVDLILYENQEIPIVPGDALLVVSNVVAQSINVHFRWRERFLEEPERT